MALPLIAVLLLAQTTPGPKGVEPLPFDPAAILAQPRTTLRATEQGRAVAYEGVPLASLLPPRPAGVAEMAALRGLSDAVIVVRGSDGYQVAISAAAVAMDPRGERYLLAVARGGKPLDDRDGPVQLVIPGDPMRVRWCRGVASARLVRAGSLDASP